MTVWLWILAGLAAYVALSLLVTLAFGMTLARVRRSREEEEIADGWTVAPLTRERRWSADRARELVGALRAPLRPARLGATTVEGSPRDVFVEALQRGDVIAANRAVREMGGLTLGDALALCVVLAERDAARYRLAAPRRLSRFVDECGDVSVEEVLIVQAALGALPSAPLLARPVLRELARARRLVTVSRVFDDVVAA